MSTASEWAANIAAKDDQMRTAEAQVPFGWKGSDISAEVTRGGGLHISKEALLTGDAALALGQWLVATYG